MLVHMLYTHSQRCIFMKSYRQAAILDVMEREAITSQEQLRERLHGRGIEATQATLSRDIRDLGLIKRPIDGAYRRPGAADLEPAGDPSEVARTAVVDYLRRHDAVDQLLVLKTDSGMAQPLAVSIDRARLHEIVGTIAGDDTILVICRSSADAAALARRLDEWMKG
jgi:transcriptional regulator of arginine metabolism